MSDSKIIQAAANETRPDLGQKASIQRSKKAIAAFKLRENLAIGTKVTLRKHRMYEFLDRLINTALPRRARLPRRQPEKLRRPRQLRAGPQGTDRIPEVNYDKIDQIRGMDIIICTTAKTDEEGKALLAGFQMPFIKKSDHVAKLSSINKNNRRAALAKKHAPKRAALKAIIMNRELPLEERLEAQFKLSAMPRNGAKIRHRNRCELTAARVAPIVNSNSRASSCASLVRSDAFRA